MNIKIEGVSFMFVMLLTILFIIINGIVIKKHTKEIEYLNNRLDSITINNK